MRGTENGWKRALMGISARTRRMRRVEVLVFCWAFRGHLWRLQESQHGLRLGREAISGTGGQR